MSEEGVAPAILPAASLQPAQDGTVQSGTTSDKDAQPATISHDPEYYFDDSLVTLLVRLYVLSLVGLR